MSAMGSDRNPEIQGWRIGAVGDDVAVEVLDQTLWRDLRLNIGVAVQRSKPVIAARLILEEVGRAVLRAERASLRAMDDDALEIRDRLMEVVGRLHGFWRIGAEHVVDVAADVFEFDIGDPEGADIAAGTRERHPRRRRVLAVLRKHLRRSVSR